MMTSLVGRRCHVGDDSETPYEIVAVACTENHGPWRWVALVLPIVQTTHKLADTVGTPLHVDMLRITVIEEP